MIWDVLEGVIMTVSSIGFKLKDSFVDTGEPDQEAPLVAASQQTKVDWLFKNFRNKKEQTTGEYRFYNDAAGGTTKEEVATSVKGD